PCPRARRATWYQRARSGLHCLSSLDKEEDHPTTPPATTLCPAWVWNTGAYGTRREIVETSLFCNFFFFANYYGTPLGSDFCRAPPLVKREYNSWIMIGPGC